MLIINNNNLVQTLMLLCYSEYLDSNYLSYFNIYGINQTFLMENPTMKLPRTRLGEDRCGLRWEKTARLY